MARPRPTPQPREVKLFRNSRSRAVRIPAEFALPGDRVRISRDGDRLILEPIEEDFPDFDDRLPPLDDDPL